jgi:hypothetical protein
MYTAGKTKFPCSFCGKDEFIIEAFQSVGVSGYFTSYQYICNYCYLRVDILNEETLNREAMNILKVFIKDKDTNPFALERLKKVRNELLTAVVAELL